MPYWRVPKLWPGQTVAVMASGPSMSAAVAAKVAHLPRITVNSTWRLARDADVCYGADALWWAQYAQEMEIVKRKVSIEVRAGCYPTLPADVLVLQNTGREGFDPNPCCLRSGDNSGYQAIQIAVHGGAKRVLLLGFDMRGGHWHGDHPSPLGNNGRALFGRWIERFKTLAGPLKDLGVEVLNCTPGSVLDCFERASLDEVLS